MTVLSTRAGGSDHVATLAGVTTFLRPPVRRIEIGMLITMVRPSLLSLGRSTFPTAMVLVGIIRRPPAVAAREARCRARSGLRSSEQCPDGRREHRPAAPVVPQSAPVQ